MNNNKETPVKLSSLTVGYGNKTLIENATVSFKHGCFTALVGRNGTGKSTLLRTMVALTHPISGKVEINGREATLMSRREMARNIGFVSTEDIRITDLKVKDVVSLGRAPYTNWTGRLSEEDEYRTERALNLVGMSSFANKCIANLSDGERQRIMIARVLAQDTPIIILDEPTAFLDIPNKYEICLLLKSLAEKEGKCIISSSHDLDIVLKLCDHVAMIDNKQISCKETGIFIESGQVELLFRNTPLIFDKVTHSIKLK